MNTQHLLNSLPPNALKDFKKHAASFLLFGLLFSCGSDPVIEKKPKSQQKTRIQNRGHELVHKMVEKTGNYADLKTLKNVEYSYLYRTPDGKEDLSIERYIFDGELSAGVYLKNERTLPQLVGKMEQVYDGKTFRLIVNGTEIKDSKLLEDVAFTRKTNFFWFSMMQKMLDPGMTYEFLRKETIENQVYDVVKVGYTGTKPTDFYHLYLNRETGLADQFLFTVVDKGVVDQPLLMKVKYEKFENVLIPTYRKYTKANWSGKIKNDSLWVEEISNEIHFGTPLSKRDFR